MKRVLRYLAISVLAAALITGATFLVGESVVAPIPGSHGAAGSADVYGFPIPYSTFFPCCSQVGGAGYHVSLDNTYFWNPVGLLVDFAIWLAISLAAVPSLTVRKLLVAAAVGAGATIATLLLGPLSIVAPSAGLETSVLKPMGFPYEYLVYYVTSLPGTKNPSGYEFYLSPALADFALWTGIVLATAGVAFKAVTIMRTRQHAIMQMPPRDGSNQ